MSRRNSKIFNRIEDCPPEQEIINKRIIDIKGQVYNSLKVLYYVWSHNGRAEWLCECLNCGRYVIVNSHNLRTGHTKTCGCLISEKLRFDYTNMQINYIKVLSYAFSRKEEPYWNVKCNNCGREFVMSAESLRKNPTSCGCLKSKGELHIIKLLQKHNIEYKQQYTFSDLRSKYKQPLKFDFAIFYDHKLSHLIEFQGIQHYYNSFDISDNKFIESQERDQQKRNYCEKNNIPLIEIKYNQDFDIDDLLIYRTKQIKDEDFQDYKKCSILISNTVCDFKCDKENGNQLCQNMPLIKSKTQIYTCAQIVNRYLQNSITSSIIFGGLEQFDEFDQLISCIDALRRYTEDDIVIYTGYNKNEITEKVNYLATRFKNIIVKYGRFVPHDTPRYDKVLGITLASQNQYAEKIS